MLKHILQTFPHQKRQCLKGAPGLQEAKQLFGRGMTDSLEPVFINPDKQITYRRLQHFPSLLLKDTDKLSLHFFTLQPLFKFLLMVDKIVADFSIQALHINKPLGHCRHGPKGGEKMIHAVDDRLNNPATDFWFTNQPGQALQKRRSLRADHLQQKFYQWFRQQIMDGFSFSGGLLHPLLQKTA